MHILSVCTEFAVWIKCTSSQAYTCASCNAWERNGGVGGIAHAALFKPQFSFWILNTQILELEMCTTTEIIFFKIEKFEDIGVNCSACRIRVISMFCECVYFLHSESLWTPPGKFKLQKRWALSEAWVWGDLFTIDVTIEKK